MKTYRVVIADDEPLIRTALERLAALDPEVEVRGCCSDGEAALAAIRQERPDIAFLDVQMPMLDGFEVLAALPPAERPIVVFVTAHERHALRAFEVSAVDYLLKPFEAERFTTALAKAKHALHRGETAHLSHQVALLLDWARRIEPRAAGVDVPAPALVEGAERVVLKVEGGLHFIKSSEIVWIEAQGDYVNVQTAGRRQRVRDTLRNVERKLDPAKFLRIHRSFVVNMGHVERVEAARYGDYTVFMSDGAKLRLSRSYRATIQQLVRLTAAG